MNERYTDEELQHKYGMRGKGNSLFEPQELGYRCQKGHSNITWSEFNEHIWCYECDRDFHYAFDCVLIDNKHMPKDLPEQPFIIKGIEVFASDGNTFNDIPIEMIDELTNKELPAEHSEAD